jgi:hypothetical protein
MADPIMDAYKDCPGDLNSEEITFISDALISDDTIDANLTFIFGHHSLRGWGAIEGGRDDLISLLGDYDVSMYGYGHTHAEKQNDPYYDFGALAFNVASLCEDNQYAIIAVDNDGVSVAEANINTWPIVLITTPIDKNLGGTNPYAYQVPESETNPIRALVFDENSVTQVQYSIDGGAWYPMANVGATPLWEALWDNTSLSEGYHTIEVQATSSTTSTDSITVGYNLSAPLVRSTHPADSSADVAVNTAITATFSEAIDASTITTETFLVNDGSANISGTVSYGDSIATFTPSSDLNYETTYTASITTGAKDMEDNALEAESRWSFTTEPEDEWYEDVCFISTAASGFRVGR